MLELAEVRIPTEREANLHIQNMLAQFLADKHAQCETITYAELSQVAGDSVQGSSKGAYHLNVARKRVKRESGIVFETVSRIGLKPVPVGQISRMAGVKATSRIQSATTEFQQTLSVVDTSKLTPAELRTHLQEQVRCGLYKLSFGDGTTARIQAAEEEAKARLLEIKAENIKRATDTALQYALSVNFG